MSSFKKLISETVKIGNFPFSHLLYLTVLLPNNKTELISASFFKPNDCLGAVEIYESKLVPSQQN
jgi:hypothetical protein